MNVGFFYKNFTEEELLALKKKAVAEFSDRGNTIIKRISIGDKSSDLEQEMPLATYIELINQALYLIDSTKYSKLAGSDRSVAVVRSGDCLETD